MNNTITLPQVITQLAKLTNTDSNTARLFLRAFFANIEKNLAAGETVVIKNIGTFRRSDDPTFGSGEGVVFVPDKAITDEINAPFAMFSAVELADGVTEADLAPAEPEAQPEPVAPAAATPAQPEPVVTDILPEPAPAPVLPATPEIPEPTPAPEPEPKTEPQPEPQPKPEPVAPQPVAAPAPAVEVPKPQPVSAPAAPKTQPAVRPVAAPALAFPKDEEEIAAPAPKRKSRVWLWAVLLIIVAVVGGYFAAVYAVPDFEWDDEVEAVEEEIPTEPLPEIDVDEASIGAASSQPDAANQLTSGPENTAEATVEPAPAPAPEPAQTPSATSSEPKYDTVTSSRFLSTMAREYYGHNIFWVYIYEANKDHLGDPNKVGAGTRVMIPDKSSLPQASSRKEAIRMAEKKAAEIQARFRK